MARSATSLGIALLFIILCFVIYFLVSSSGTTDTTTKPPPDEFAQNPGDKEATTPPPAPPEPEPEPVEEPDSKTEDPGEPPTPQVPSGPPSPPSDEPLITVPGGETDDEPAPPPTPPDVGDTASPSVSEFDRGTMTPGTADEEEVFPQYASYTIQDGDDAWTIAVEKLHDGSRWKEIVELNPGLPEDGDNLTPGLTIKLPNPPAVNAVEEEPTDTAEVSSWPYEVKDGDTLSGIAKEFYGDGTVTVWMAILGANPGLDSERMPVGKKINLPVIDGKKPTGLAEEKAETAPEPATP